MTLKLKHELCGPGWCGAVVGLPSCNYTVTGSISAHGTHLGSRFDPRLKHKWQATNWCFSFTLMFLSLPSSLSKITMKKCPQVMIKKNSMYKKCTLISNLTYKTSWNTVYFLVCSRLHVSRCWIYQDWTILSIIDFNHFPERRIMCIHTKYSNWQKKRFQFCGWAC